MTWVPPFHSVQPGTTDHHTNTICDVGRAIPAADLVAGTGGLDPEPPWTGSPAPSRLTGRMLYIAAASWSGHDADTAQVSFRGSPLATLTDDEVLVRTGDVLPRNEPDDLACNHD